MPLVDVAQTEIAVAHASPGYRCLCHEVVVSAEGDVGVAFQNEQAGIESALVVLDLFTAIEHFSKDLPALAARGLGQSAAIDTDRGLVLPRAALLIRHCHQLIDRFVEEPRRNGDHQQQRHEYGGRDFPVPAHEAAGAVQDAGTARLHRGSSPTRTCPGPSRSRSRCSSPER